MAIILGDIKENENGVIWFVFEDEQYGIEGETGRLLDEDGCPFQPEEGKAICDRLEGALCDGELLGQCGLSQNEVEILYSAVTVNA